MAGKCLHTMYLTSSSIFDRQIPHAEKIWITKVEARMKERNETKNYWRDTVRSQSAASVSVSFVHHSKSQNMSRTKRKICASAAAIDYNTNSIHSFYVSFASSFFHSFFSLFFRTRLSHMGHFDRPPHLRSYLLCAKLHFNINFIIAKIPSVIIFHNYELKVIIIYRLRRPTVHKQTIR